jgi:ABC-type nitrate/sulfonate/bicarbonate transport system permease component
MLAIVYRFRHALLFLSVVVFIGVWWGIAIFVNSPNAFASPLQTVYALATLFQNPAIRALFVVSLKSTLLATFEGFALAAVVGIPIGILMGRYLVAEYMFDPWVNAWYSIPAIAFVPLVMNWAGVTSTSAMLVAFMIAVFAVIINVITGVKEISGSLIDPAKAFGANQTQVFTKIILPAALPNIMLGLRYGVSRALEGVIVAEMVFSVVGIGGMIFDTADQLRIALTVALILVLAFISIGLNEGMKYINRKVIFWKESASLARR